MEREQQLTVDPARLTSDRDGRQSFPGDPAGILEQRVLLGREGERHGKRFTT
jgi:hypothetical protein